MQLDGLLAFASSGRTRKGLGLNCVLSALTLLGMHFNILAIPAEYQGTILTWAVSCLVSGGLLGLTSSFVTKEVKDAACSFCGSPMTTKTLKCTKCPGVSTLDD